MILWIWLIPILEAGAELLIGATIGTAVAGAIIYHLDPKFFDFVTKSICTKAVNDQLNNVVKYSIKNKSDHVVKLDILTAEGNEYDMKIEGRDGVSDDIEEGDVIYV